MNQTHTPDAEPDGTHPLYPGEAEKEAIVAFFRVPRATYTTRDVAQMLGWSTDETRRAFKNRREAGSARTHQYRRYVAIRAISDWWGEREIATILRDAGVVVTGDDLIALTERPSHDPETRLLTVSPKTKEALARLVEHEKLNMRHGGRRRDGGEYEVFPNEENVVADLVAAEERSIGPTSPLFLAALYADRLVETVRYRLDECRDAVVRNASGLLNEFASHELPGLDATALPHYLAALSATTKHFAEIIATPAAELPSLIARIAAEMRSESGSGA